MRRRWESAFNLHERNSCNREVKAMSGNTPIGELHVTAWFSLTGGLWAGGPRIRPAPIDSLGETHIHPQWCRARKPQFSETRKVCKTLETNPPHDTNRPSPPSSSTSRQDERPGPEQDRPQQPFAAEPLRAGAEHCPGSLRPRDQHGRPQGRPASPADRLCPRGENSSHLKKTNNLPDGDRIRGPVPSPTRHTLPATAASAPSSEREQASTPIREN